MEEEGLGTGSEKGKLRVGTRRGMPPQDRGEGIFQLQRQSQGLGDLEPPLGLALTLATVLHHMGAAQDTGISLTSFRPGRDRTAENPLRILRNSFGVSGDLRGTRGKGE